MRIHNSKWQTNLRQTYYLPGGATCCLVRPRTSHNTPRSFGTVVTWAWEQIHYGGSQGRILKVEGLLGVRGGNTRIARVRQMHSPRDEHRHSQGQTSRHGCRYRYRYRYKYPYGDRSYGILHLYLLCDCMRLLRGVAGDNSCQKGEQVPKVSDEGDILSPLLSILKIDLNNNNVHLF